jgi:hypothetical protein
MESLTLDERERLVDSALKIQSVRDSLTKVEPQKISAMHEISECLHSVDKHLRTALGYNGPRDPVS